MFGIRIIAFFCACLLFVSCHKENGKHEYEMRLMFDSGDVFTDDGKIEEKSLKRRKGQELYIDVFNGYMFLKLNGNKFVCSDPLYLRSDAPVNFAGGQSGVFNGDIYFEGNYTQKGRAYTVDNGYFEFIWRDDSTGQPVNSIVYKGKWTLKRK